MRLRAENLAYGFPGRTLGTGIALTLAPGDVTCVLGPNGGGKTTLFRTLLGLLPAHGGTIELDGRPLADWHRADLARQIAYVPQQHAGHFDFSVRDVVLMGRTAHIGLFGAPGPADRDAADAALASLGLALLAGQAYTRISGGERQLVLIARALAQGSQLLLLDEPTASLDFGNQVLVLRRIKELAARGIGVLFSSHNPDQAFLCATSVLMLRGSVLHNGRPADIITRERLRELYGVDVEVVDLPHPPGMRACVPTLDS